MSYEAWVHDKRSMTILEFPLFPSMVLVPIGAALLGKRPRQKVTVQTPSGVMKLTIVKIH